MSRVSTFLLCAVLVGCAASRTRATLAEGAPAPAFELADLEGRPVRLDTLRGHVVLLDFWASWCEPCKEAMPFYDRLQAEVGGALVVLGVNLDEDPAALRAALAARPVRFRVLQDPRGQVAELYGVDSMPASFVIARDGRLVKHLRGFVASDEAALRPLVQQLVDEP